MWKKHLTISEAADFLGVSAQTLRIWDKTGKLSASRDGGNKYRMYKISDLEKLALSSESKRRRRQKVELGIE